MPLYDYQCEVGHRYEKREPFGSPAQQPCDTCGKPARRLLNVPPIVFKGSGWYVTDSQRTMRGAVGMERDGGPADDDGDSGSDSESGTTEAAEKPAAKKKPAAKAKTTRAPKAKSASADD